MCLAIYKPATTAPDWDAYRAGMASNPDGWGFAVIDQTGEMLVACGMGKFDEFKHSLEPYSDCVAIIHFRWATHGKKNIDNCHPFIAYREGETLAMIHNGIVSIDTSDDENKSDTSHFMDGVIRPQFERDRDFFTRPDVIWTNETAHSSSKFVFLRSDGTHEIWNEADGEWESDGHWYSNTGYLYYRRSASTSTTTTAVSSYYDRYRDSHPQTVTFDLTKGREDDDERDYQRWKYGEEQIVSVDMDDPSPDPLGRAGDLYDRLANYGFTHACLDEVFGLLGIDGLEALADYS